MNACVCASLFSSARFSSVAQSCPTLCDPMNRSTPGLPVHRQLPEFTQTHVHRVGDAIQPSHPLSSPSSSAPQSLPASESFPMSQLFAWGGQSWPIVCDPLDCSPTGSSVPGILLARIPEWVTMLSSRGPSWPRDQTCVSSIAVGFFTPELLGKP